MPSRKISYEILNPVKEIQTEEEINQLENFKSEGRFPAAEFDDIAEFFIFLKEAGIEKKENHIIVSIQEVDSIRVRSIYFLITQKNLHIMQEKSPRLGYMLVNQTEVT